MSNELIVSKDKFPSKKGGLNQLNPRKGKYKLCIRKVDFCEENSFDSKFAWICTSLGFFEEIDKDKIGAAIFKELFLAGTIGQVLTSTVIAQRIGMSRGTTINHLNRLKNSGLIEKGGKYYFVRGKNMKAIIEEIEDDVIHIFSRMKRVAKEIDNETDRVIRMK